ncbi:hypothetical protein DFH06DRAFT_1133342 [Mycena polygramma]|nr:hypothetical protein DFH06DRAFT_1133342 [Mycena polygramma]
MAFKLAVSRMPFLLAAKQRMLSLPLPAAVYHRGRSSWLEEVPRRVETEDEGFGNKHRQSALEPSLKFNLYTFCAWYAARVPFKCESLISYNPRFQIIVALDLALVPTTYYRLLLYWYSTWTLVALLAVNQPSPPTRRQASLFPATFLRTPPTGRHKSLPPSPSLPCSPQTVFAHFLMPAELYTVEETEEEKRERQRLQARARAARHRAAVKALPPDAQQELKQRARASRAKYRARHRWQLIVKERDRREQSSTRSFLSLLANLTFLTLVSKSRETQSVDEFIRRRRARQRKDNVQTPPLTPNAAEPDELIDYNY